MARKARELSVVEVKAKARTTGFHAVGGVAGLLLQVPKGPDGLPTGARSWVLRTTVDGRRRAFGLGSYEHVTLAEARERARDMRRKIDAGADPAEDRRTARKAQLIDASVLTFDEAARRFIEVKGAGWKNPKHRAQWAASLRTYASPIIGHMPVRDIEVEHVEAVLEPIWTRINETADRVRGRIEQILDYAAAGKHRKGDNPARWSGNLKFRLADKSNLGGKQHQPALPYSQIGEFVAALRDMPGTAPRALEFLILTGVRSGEARGAVWGEFDLDAAIWTIPAARMKKEKDHEVPLSAPALAILREFPRTGRNGVVFPGTGRHGVLSENALREVIQRLNRIRAAQDLPKFVDPAQGDREVTAHGFRSTLRDWAGEQTDHQREVIEHALSHKLKDKTEAAYARRTLFPKRIQLMADWAENIESGIDRL